LSDALVASSAQKPMTQFVLSGETWVAFQLFCFLFLDASWLPPTILEQFSAQFGF
jgi:hypothetical protein